MIESPGCDLPLGKAQQNLWKDGQKMQKVKKAVLAYSGGLDTSVIIPWLRENYGCEVVAVTGNVGQGDDELFGLEEKAINSGACKIYIEDLRKEFVEEYIFPTLQAGAVYEGSYLLGTSFARPVIAKRLVEIAERENADAIAHGCTGKGNDQVRFELSIRAFAPEMKIIAPWREWNIRSRLEAIEYAEKRNIPLRVTRDNIYSNDKNIWHVSHEGMELEDPTHEPQYEKILELSCTPEKAPDNPVYVTIEYKKGIPIAVDDVYMDGVALIEKLNVIGGKNGIGILDFVENRLVGMKSRGLYETPGGTILYKAHNILESITLDKDTNHLKATLGVRFAELVYNGQWFTPVREALSAFVKETQKYVTGKVKLRLYKGNIIPAGVTSPHSLYNQDLASFGDKDYNHMESQGFINLFGLQYRVAASAGREWV